MKQSVFFCIDMKSFFASVECAERGLNPFETNLVVADEKRGRGAICLAVSPKMKSLGVKNRCRLFEIPQNMDYIIAKPRMKKYIEYAADIYETYLDYIAPEDIHVYSIDEAFLDVTDYLKIYKTDPKSFARTLLKEIAAKTHIPATAGIGTNLYLAKIALDITAKHAPDHIGFLDEETYRATLWDHKPLTDFWQISRGTVNRLAKYGVTTMRQIAALPEDVLYKTFGINAEILIDHAYGREPCTMYDIKHYKSKSKSISNSQILFEDYTYEKASVVLEEMCLTGCQELMKRKQVASHVGIFVGYSSDVYPPTGGNAHMTETTNAFSVVYPYVKRLYEETTEKDLPIRRLGIEFSHLSDDSMEGFDLFTDVKKVEKEKKIENAVLALKDKFGKNAMLRGIDLTSEGTTKIRNTLIGGHNGE